MKTIVIGDCHGRDKWKQQVDQDFNQCVFVGDYFDSFDNTAKEQIPNFEEILQFKRENTDKVTLLLGNHDISYLSTYCICPGYQSVYAQDIRALLEPLVQSDEVQAIKVIDNYLFVHAGITKTWYDKNKIRVLEESINGIEEAVNTLFKTKYEPFAFQDPPSTVSFRNISHYGDDIWQSPMWVRPASLIKDKIDGYIQVIGHTYVDKPTFKDGIWLTDCQGNTDEILILEI